MPEKPRNKFAGMTMKELDNILRGLYPEYLPELLTTTGLVLDEAEEDFRLLEESYDISNPKLLKNGFQNLEQFLFAIKIIMYQIVVMKMKEELKFKMMLKLMNFK